MGCVGRQLDRGMAGRPPGPPTATRAPLKKYSAAPRAVRRAAAGSVQRAPGAIFSVQMATSASARAAHESGGGASGAALAGAARSAAGDAGDLGRARRRRRWRRGAGCPRDQSIVKCGSAILLRAGRLSQIWNSSSGLGARGVEQREHLRMHDAAAGGEPLHVAAAEARRGAERIGVVDQALAHDGHGLEAAVRMRREARHRVAVVHAPAVLAGEVLAEVAPGQRRVAGPSCRCRAGRRRRGRRRTGTGRSSATGSRVLRSATGWAWCTSRKLEQVQIVASLRLFVALWPTPAACAAAWPGAGGPGRPAASARSVAAGLRRALQRAAVCTAPDAGAQGPEHRREGGAPVPWRSTGHVLALSAAGHYRVIARFA